FASHCTTYSHTSTLSLHDALPISNSAAPSLQTGILQFLRWRFLLRNSQFPADRLPAYLGLAPALFRMRVPWQRHRPLGYLHRLGDRKSTRLNSSHVTISYAVFCLK